MKFRRGWFNDSHRHYLAAKGISTNRYFVRHDLKGNRGSSLLHSLYARGYSNPEIAQDPSLPTPLRNEALNKLRSRQTEALINVPERAGGDAPSTAPSTIPTLEESVTFSPLQEEAVPVIEQAAPQPQMLSATNSTGLAPISSEGFEEPASLTPLEIPAEEDNSEEPATATVLTPGVPELPGYDMVKE